jgi:hypothetical protein
MLFLCHVLPAELDAQRHRISEVIASVEQETLQKLRDECVRPFNSVGTRLVKQG